MILLLALAPLAQAGHGPVLAMGEAEHSESMMAEHRPGPDTDHHTGGHNPMSDCHGSEIDMDCCASCVGCAVPMASSGSSQPAADPGATAGTFPPMPDPERQQRPPRQIIS